VNIGVAASCWKLKPEEKRRRINEGQRRRYAKNRERWQGYRAKRSEVEKPIARERSRQWRIDNPERLREQTRQWRARNRERRRATELRGYHKRRAQDPEKIRAQQRKWRAENPDAVRADNSRRRARDGSSYTPEDVQRLFTTQRGKCAACKIALESSGRNKYHVDHIYPLKPRRGRIAGTNHPSNLQLLCMPCNRSKGNLHPDEWAKRLGSAPRRTTAE
jgi:5-methylcytosine-specific restriction endonuclease McrA